MTDRRVTMSEEFDPYMQWLGILAHERPIDHYRLLDIARFSSDPAAITAAADRRMAQIRSYQTGPRGRLTQPLLNEIAAAKLCLLNPAAKSAYDAMLEGLASATQPPPIAAAPAYHTPPPPTPPPPPPQSPPNEVKSTSALTRTPSLANYQPVQTSAHDRSSSTSGGSIVLAVAVLVIVGMGSYVTWQVIVAGRQPRIGNASDAAIVVQQDQTAGAGNAFSSEPTVVFQESDGSVNFTPSVAVLTGPALRLETVGITDTVIGWTSPNDSATWKCKVVKLPPNGVFRVLVTYRASLEADGGSFQLAIGGHEKTAEMRGTGEFLTDEYFLAVTRSGVQTMELRSPALPGGTFEVKSVRLVMPPEAN